MRRVILFIALVNVVAGAEAYALVTDPWYAPGRSLASARVNTDGNPAPIEGSSRTRILVLDMSPADKTRQVINRTFSFSSADDDPEVQKLRKALLDLGSPNSTDEATGASKVMDLLRTQAAHLTEHSSNRWIGSRGDKIQVYILRVAGCPARIDVDEAPRETRLSSDLVTFVQVALKIATAGGRALTGREPEYSYSYTFREFYLTKTRATLKVMGTFVPADTPKVKQEPVPAPCTAKADDSKQASQLDTAKVRSQFNIADLPNLLSTSLTTGPREHFFLSANVAAFTKARQVKYDETRRSLEPDATPKEFLVGLNYTLGDVFEEENHGWFRRFRDGIYLGLLVEGSTKPLDQISAIVGFRHAPPVVDRILTFEAVSPYVGVVWARNYRTDSAAVHRVDTDYATAKFVAGVSLNLDKALEWVGGR